jgi:hypothetical protein
MTFYPKKTTTQPGQIQTHLETLVTAFHKHRGLGKTVNDAWTEAKKEAESPVLTEKGWKAAEHYLKNTVEPDAKGLAKHLLTDLFNIDPDGFSRVKR